MKQISYRAALSYALHQTGGRSMSETQKSVAETENDREITEQEATEVTGGFNPQPDPPGRHG
jgi:hypothetical protein